MKFGDPGGEGIIEDVRFLTESGSNSYATKDIARNANRWAYKAVTWIFDATHGVQFDDSAHTDRAIAKFDLVDDQDWYTFPTDMLKFDQLHIKDTNGDFYKLRHIDQMESDVALDEVYDTKGKPLFYDMYGPEFRLFPAADSSDVTISEGGKIFYRREIDLFEPSNTAQQPGFAAPFHRIPALGAAYDWLIVNGPQERANAIRTELEQLKEELYEFYNDFNEDDKISIKPNNMRPSTRRQWE